MTKRHNAEIEIVASPGLGTTIKLDFPLARGEVSVTKPSFTVHDITPMRILIVDDDPLGLNSLQEALVSDGMTLSQQVEVNTALILSDLPRE